MDASDAAGTGIFSKIGVITYAYGKGVGGSQF